MVRLTTIDYEEAAGLRGALRRFRQASERITQRHGLTSERYELLLLIELSRRRGDNVTVAGLAKELELAQSTVTQLVRRAENLRLVRRELAGHDARIRYLQLTDEGARRLQAAVADLRRDRSHVFELLAELTTDRR